MEIRASCDLTFENEGPVPMVLMLRPRSGAAQWVSAESYVTTPSIMAIEYVDLYGNLCQRIVAPPGEFRISASATVQVADEVDHAPGVAASAVEALSDDLLHFLLPSRYCESDKLSGLAFEVAGEAVPGYDQVERVRSWIHETISYESGSSNSSTSASETAAQGRGVCRDMAHLGISLTRALGMPARMVVGYLHGLVPMDLHAWFEAFIGGQWYTFDPKEPETLGGRIVIGYGRDATDVALATQFGPSQLSALHVTVDRLS